MIDTPENIDETIKELHEWFDSIDTSGEEYQNMDLSYLEEDSDNSMCSEKDRNY